jgi:hypothetical protein
MKLDHIKENLKIERSSPVLHPGKANDLDATEKKNRKHCGLVQK